MEKCGVLCAVGTESLDMILVYAGFKGLKTNLCTHFFMFKIYKELEHTPYNILKYVL